MRDLKDPRPKLFLRSFTSLTLNCLLKSGPCAYLPLLQSNVAITKNTVYEECICRHKEVAWCLVGEKGLFNLGENITDSNIKT